MTDPNNPSAPAGSDLPHSPFAADDGSTPPALLAALTRLADRSGDSRAVMGALASGRLLVPVVTSLEQVAINEAGRQVEKESSMATVLVQREDGSCVMLAFTSVHAMTLWRADARPVPVTAIQAATVALTEGASVLLVDAAGPIPFAVADDDLRALAGAQIVRPPMDEKALRSTLGELMSGIHGLADAYLRRSDPPELVICVDPSLDQEAYQSLMQTVAGRLQKVSDLAVTMPQGLRIQVVAAGEKPMDTPSLLHDG